MRLGARPFRNFSSEVFVGLGKFQCPLRDTPIELLGETPLFAQHLCFPQRDRRLVRRDGEEKSLLLFWKVHPPSTRDDDAESAVETQR